MYKQLINTTQRKFILHMQMHCTMKQQTKWNKHKQNGPEYTKNTHILCWDLGGVKNMGCLLRSCTSI